MSFFKTKTAEITGYTVLILKVELTVNAPEINLNEYQNTKKKITTFSFNLSKIPIYTFLANGMMRLPPFVTPSVLGFSFIQKSGHGIRLFPYGVNTLS
jgi:hypothetical protein